MAPVTFTMPPRNIIVFAIRQFIIDGISFNVDHSETSETFHARKNKRTTISKTRSKIRIFCFHCETFLFTEMGLFTIHAQVKNIRLYLLVVWWYEVWCVWV